MKLTIKKLEQKTDDLSGQISLLKKEGKDLEASELQTLLDGFNKEKSNINIEYSKAIQETIDSLNVSDLEEVAKKHGLISIEDAKCYLYNLIMSEHGLDLEAFYETLELLHDSKINGEEATLFMISMKRYSEINNKIKNYISTLKESKKTEIQEYNRLEQEITETRSKKAICSKMIRSLEDLIKEISLDEVIDIGFEIAELNTGLENLSLEDVDLVVELLTLRKEKGIKRLIHTSKRQQNSTKIKANEKLKEEREHSLELANKNLSLTVNLVLGILNSDEIQLLTTHSTNTSFNSVEALKNTIRKCIIDRDLTTIKDYVEVLKRYAKELEQKEQSLVKEQEQYKKTVQVIKDMENKPLDYLALYGLTGTEQQEIISVSNRFPVVTTLTDEEIELFSTMTITDEMLLLNKNKKACKTRILQTKKGN